MSDFGGSLNIFLFILEPESGLRNCYIAKYIRLFSVELGSVLFRVQVYFRQSLARQKRILLFKQLLDVSEIIDDQEMLQVSQNALVIFSTRLKPDIF